MPTEKLNVKNLRILYIRNIWGYLSLYVGIRYAIIILLHHDANSIYTVMMYYVYSGFILYWAGRMSSEKIREETDDYGHTKYLKYEIVVVAICIGLIEIFLI